MRFVYILVPLFVVLSAMLSGYRTGNEDYRKKINELYLTGLTDFSSRLTRLNASVSEKKPVNALRDQFGELRLAYKRISVITDYFNPLETKLWNSPALPRTEEGNPRTVIDPHGFQLLEELIWEKEPDYGLIQQEVQFLSGIVKMLENEPDRLNKFRNELVWDALYSALIRMITLGISGFDSPVALLSLKESQAVIEGVSAVLEVYAEKPEQKSGITIIQIQEKLREATAFLKDNPDFNRFDRMAFIKDYINPVTRLIKMYAKQRNYILPDERRSLNPESAGIFDKDVFDIRFFSPNSRHQLTPERIELGKKLFYDPQLSGTGSRSCGTCHKPELAFTDGMRFGISLDEHKPLKRNTPTLLNAVFQTRQFYDSRTTMLEFQVNDVIHNISEMKGMLDTSAKKLRLQETYLKAFQSAYPGESDAVSRFTISNAIASYIRTLTSMNTRFDRYMRGENVALSNLEKQGFNLFMGRAKCGTCHFMPLFNGLVPPFFTETESEVLGVPAEKSGRPRLDTDSGKYYYTRSPIHLFSFKTPTVRNSTRTAPYMHNGVFDTLDEVLDFYDKGGGEGLGIAPENQTLPPDKLNLSKKEKKALIAFLKTLEDTSVAVNRN